ncbi:MAG: DUF262 domain-containing protein [Coriobacteriales bacterium]|jgi:hypothetical protein|nr:DUF262 domain-containing protein [Coriobacteriales bacterium]
MSEQADCSQLTPDILSIRDLLSSDSEFNDIELFRKGTLSIPYYQRPYKWRRKNVQQLIGDIRDSMQRPKYRIGTVILHEDDGKLNVVDGQQRIITFSIIALYLDKKNNEGRIKIDDIPKPDITPSPFGREASERNILENYKAVGEILSEYDDDYLATFANYFLHNCEVIIIRLARLDEAFQMFDSQNSRGKALYPTDLLKAFHIREMNPRYVTDEQRLAMVRLWEDIEPTAINSLFSDYLYKIKCWAFGNDVDIRGFSADHIELFKGIHETDLNDAGNYNSENNWAKPFLYAKSYIDDHRNENQTLIRYGALQPIEYPFQLDHPIINGETFFRMVDHYYKLCLKYDLLDDEGIEDTVPDSRIIEQVREFDHDTRYNYVRNLFNCLLLFYVDRFGEQELERALKKLFMYAYLPRVSMSQVRRWTINKYALGSDSGRMSTISKINLFSYLQQTHRATDFLDLSLPTPPSNVNRNSYPELWEMFDNIQDSASKLQLDADDNINTKADKRAAAESIVIALGKLSPGDADTVRESLHKIGIIRHKRIQGAKWESTLWDGKKSLSEVNESLIDLMRKEAE